MMVPRLGIKGGSHLRSVFKTALTGNKRRVLPRISYHDAMAGIKGQFHLESLVMLPWQRIKGEFCLKSAMMLP
jgi:hypothetical protein